MDGQRVHGSREAHGLAVAHLAVGIDPGQQQRQDGQDDSRDLEQRCGGIVEQWVDQVDVDKLDHRLDQIVVDRSQQIFDPIGQGRPQT